MKNINVNSLLDLLGTNGYTYINTYIGSNYNLDFKEFKRRLFNMCGNNLEDTLYLYYNNNGIKIYSTYTLTNNMNILVVVIGNKIYGIDLSYLGKGNNIITKDKVQDVVLRNIGFGYKYIKDLDARKIYFNLLVNNRNGLLLEYKDCNIGIKNGKYSYNLMCLYGGLEMRCGVYIGCTDKIIGKSLYRLYVDVLTKDILLVEYNIVGMNCPFELVDFMELGKYECGNIFKSKLDMSLGYVAQEGALYVSIQGNYRRYDLS